MTPRLYELLDSGYAAVFACPICDSEQGQAVRDNLFNADLATNVAAMITPFALSALVVVWICRKAGAGARR